MRTSTGSFAFDATVKPLKAEDPAELETSLIEADYAVAEWEDVEKSIPDLDRWVRPSQRITGETVTLNSDQWRVLVAMGTGIGLPELMAEMDLSRLEVAREVKWLVSQGAAELSDAAPAEETAKPLESKKKPIAPAKPSAEVSPGIGGTGARGALDSMVSSLDRRLKDLGPPEGTTERRVKSGSVLDASDIGTVPGAESLGRDRSA